jgi:hypothetical protein
MGSHMIMRQANTHFILPFGNKAYCYGENLSGQLGTGDLFNKDELITIELPVYVKSISTGPQHTMIVGEGNINGVFLMLNETKSVVLQ